MNQIGGLSYRLRVPEVARDGARVFVLLHGRGADEADLLGLAPRLPAGALVVTPRAPFPGAPWGYGPGWAWYRYIEADRPDPDSFSESLDLLGGFLDGLPEALPVVPGEVVLGGFSQGATLGVAYALSHPGAVPTVAILSGFLASHPRVEASPDTVADTRFFWGHGTRDPAIPHALAERGRTALRGAGADLTTRDYPIGHWIAPGELADLVQWVETDQPGS